MSTEPKLIEVSETFLRRWEERPIDEFIDDLAERADALKLQGAIGIVVELEVERDYDDERSFLNIKYKRFETNDERLARIHQEQLNLRHAQEQRRANQMAELKERFMDGVISASEYERKKAALSRD